MIFDEVAESTLLVLINSNEQLALTLTRNMNPLQMQRRKVWSVLEVPKLVRNPKSILTTLTKPFRSPSDSPSDSYLSPHPFPSQSDQ